MRVNANLFWILAAFFWAADALYTVWNLIDHGTVEWVGTVGIGLSGILGILIAFYVGASRRAQGGELPEDRMDAEIDDGDPEIGYFSPWSWWPMILALGTALVFLGIAVGIWLCFIGAPLAFLAIIGWYYEYYRNNFAR
ncbi:MAG TPA: cytochrome c oxidase subunit 4 [Pseudolysinimonas sp.]|nr:cytochrome c oxidase subunit 4 [Pseudolysinimonas sp.]